MKLNISNTFNTNLPADANSKNETRKVFNACYSNVLPKTPSNPKLIHTSNNVAALIGLTKDNLNSTSFLNLVTGAFVYPNTTPYAMCYGGHQFGNWAGQLGDGRAINLFEVEHKNKHWALQLKGAGETPYSRNADGLAVLRSSIREHLCSEAMHYLNISTTRSLSLALTGNQVLRDVMYNGNSAYEKGAVVCRIAPSFIRFGNFEIFASRNDTNTLKALVNHTITQHFPNSKANTKQGYLDFFKSVTNRTLKMVIDWQRVGFVHGVMNTDNMSILGLTIDFGPYGWLEGYDHNWTPNTTDNQYKRYRYGNQPNIALWNLLQLANALYPLIEDAKALEAILNSYNDAYPIAYLKMMRAKLGLTTTDTADQDLINELETVLQLTETDMTIWFRNLSNLPKAYKITPNNSPLKTILKDAFYTPEKLNNEVTKKWHIWLQKYLIRLQREHNSDGNRKKIMDAVNPKYVLRNYIAQLVIDQADKGNYNLLNDIHDMLKKPYDEQPNYEKWFTKRPEWARHKVGCSMLSCSS